MAKVVKVARKESKGYRDGWVEKKDGIYGIVYYTDPLTGKRKDKTKKFPTKLLAQHWSQEEYAKMRHNGGVMEIDKTTTFAEAAFWYKTYHLFEPVYSNGVRVDGVKAWKTQRTKLDRITEYFGGRPVAAVEPIEETATTTKEYTGGQRLSDLKDDHMKAYARWRREQNYWEDGDREGVSQLTINRDFELIRALFIACQNRYDLLRIPKFPIIKSAEVERDRVITRDEEERLLAACVDRETIEVERQGRKYTTTIDAKRSHLRPLIIFALDTAIRRGETLKLDWKNVDLAKGIITVQWFTAKVPRTRKVPISDRLQKILEAMPNKTGKVFDFGIPKKAFATACERAGIEDELLFHDLRHTATTRMVDKGIPYPVVMKITGHTEMKTFMRYISQTDRSLQDTKRQMDEYLGQLEADYFAELARAELSY